jgi:hypothetical protein
MLDRVVIFLAGGRQVRWGNCGTGNECKQLVEVPWDPETRPTPHYALADRTFNQLQWWDHDSRAEYGYGVRRVRVVRSEPLREASPVVETWWDAGCTNMGEAMVRACYAAPAKNSRLVVLMGDVYWDYNSLRRLLESESFITVATDDVDTFGLSFEDTTLPIIADALRIGGKENKIRANLTKVVGNGWGRLLCDDWTQDFDIDWEHTQFLAGLSKNNHFRNTPDQVRRRRALGMRLPRRKR